MDAKVQLTTNHRGFFTFKLCPATSNLHEVTQDCLDRHVLSLSQSHGEVSNYAVNTPRSGIFDVRLKLPDNLSCDRCVLQWTYTAGNNWGRCADGKTSQVGCGPQETFRGCSDIKILPAAVRSPEADGVDEIEREGPPLPPPTRKPTTPYPRATFATSKRPSRFPAPTRIPSRPSPLPFHPTVRTLKPTSQRPFVTTRQSLPTTRRPSFRTITPRATGRMTTPSNYTKRTWTSVSKASTRSPSSSASRRPWNRNDDQGPKCRASLYMYQTPGMDSWCENNCSAGFCPSTHCSCF